MASDVTVWGGGDGKERAELAASEQSSTFTKGWALSGQTEEQARNRQEQAETIFKTAGLCER